MLIYAIHGFGSTGEGSGTVQAFVRRFKHDKVIAPTYDSVDPERAYAQLAAQMTDAIAANPGEELLIIGISLGGFWARKMADHFSNLTPKLLLLNPSLTPWVNLNKNIGTTPNYVTGVDMVLTAENVAKFENYCVSNDMPDTPIVLVTADDDDIVAPAYARTLYADRAMVINFSEGGHRLAGKTNELMEIASELSNQYTV